MNHVHCNRGATRTWRTNSGRPHSSVAGAGEESRIVRGDSATGARPRRCPQGPGANGPFLMLAPRSRRLGVGFQESRLIAFGGMDLSGSHAAMLDGWREMAGPRTFVVGSAGAAFRVSSLR